jgi:hypothetical protein
LKFSEGYFLEATYFGIYKGSIEPKWQVLRLIRSFFVEYCPEVVVCLWSSDDRCPNGGVERSLGFIMSC